jgi:hypothetical protein
MADFYYRYNNKGIEGSKTVLLNDAYLSSAVPFSSNLHRRFRAQDYNATTKVWTDSASGTTITAGSTGTISVVSHTGDKKYRTTNVVQFDKSSGITFNNDQLATYTLFAITRYINTNTDRILQSFTDNNWLSGHHGGFAGTAYHFNNFISPIIYSYATNFFIGTDISTQYFTNGRSNGTLSPSSSYLPRLGINKGAWYPDVSSDGQILDILMYNRELSETERKKVEHYLASYYGILDISGALTASYNRTPLNIETSLLVSTTESPNWIVYPTFQPETTGLSFSMWFKTDISSSSQWSRLFDFGIGTTYTISMGIVSGNLVISTYEATKQCELANVLPGYNNNRGVNDNVWRHLVWTISADGLTWKIYIDKVIQATITSSNFTNYSSSGIRGPYHPSSTMRTTNFIGKSNTGTDPAFSGAIDDFRMFNREIGVNDIVFQNKWFTNVLSTNPPVYNRIKLSTELSLLVSTSISQNYNYIFYNSFYIQQTGLTFAFWFQSNATANNGRLFDFGNGASSNNIAVSIINNNLALTTYETGLMCQLDNVFSGCNDNVWRHFIWTISADGTTWKIYIDKVLQATITSSNYTNYTSTGSQGPYHPSAVMRSSNYIGKSNASSIPLIGAIDDFHVYNYPLDQNAINNTWNMDTNGSLIPKYTRERLVTETSMLVSTTINKNSILYPSFSIQKTGMTFALWFKSDNNPDGSILIDFRTDAFNNHILINLYQSRIYLTVETYPTAYSKSNIPFNCNDNQWRHFVWTISADGLTYKAYFNKSLISTINSSNWQSFGPFANAAPYHPELVLRNRNYIGKSAVESTPYFNGSIHAFQMWNRPFEQTDINAIYTETAFNGTYTLSNFPNIQKVYGSGPFSLSNPTSTGTGTFTFTSSNTAVATIVDNVVTLVGVGTTTITALQWTETITATLTVIQPVYATPVLVNNTDTNFLATINGRAYDVNLVILRNIRRTVNLKKSIEVQTIDLGSVVNVYKKNIACTMNGISQVGDTQLSFGKAKKPMWVLGGNTTNSLSYSYDGLSWTGLGTTIMTSVVGVVWNGTLWVAVGVKSTPFIANSYDGINWTSKACPIFSTAIYDVAWNGKMFVVVGRGTNSIGYSYNGIDWYAVARSNLDIFSTFGRGIGWNGRMWVAVGSGTNKIAYSYDGIQWFPNTTTVLDAGYGITYDGQKWIAVGTGTNFIADSVDGITWTGRGKLFFTSECSGIASNGIVTVAIGRGGTTMAYSYGNNIWTAISIPTLTYGVRVKWNGSMFLAISYSTAAVFYSYDGINWNSVDSGMTFGNCVNHNNTLEHQIVVKQRTYVRGGYLTNTLSYSYDGFSWKGLGNSIFTNTKNIVYNGNIWVAVGYGTTHTMAWSFDGMNWNGLNKTIFSRMGFNIAYNGTIYIAVGSGTNTMAISSDGKTFTPITTSPFGNSGIGCGIAWNGKLWVATGYGPTKLAYSYDGTTWTNSTQIFTLGGSSVTWNGKIFVACGSGVISIAWSVDGITWTPGKISIENSTLRIYFSTAKWNGTLWLAGGMTNTSNQNVLFYSYDGKIWNNVPTNFGIKPNTTILQNINEPSMYSSIWNGDSNESNTLNSLLDSSSGWTARVSQVNQYAQLDLGSSLYVTKVTTQPLSGSTTSFRVTSYTVLTSTDGVTFVDANGGNYFSGNTPNTDANTKVSNTLVTPTLARYVRLSVKAWSGFVAMRFAVETTATITTLNNVNEASRSYSTTWNGDSPGGTYASSMLDSASGWSALVSKTTQYAQLDLGSSLYVTKVITQPSAGSTTSNRVTNYKVLTSTDGVTFVDANGGNVFSGNTENTDANTKVTNTLVTPTLARYVRLYTIAWSGFVAMRFAVETTATVTTLNNVNETSRVYSSTWDGGIAEVLSTTSVSGILWDGKKWIAGTTEQMFYSYDGFTWPNLNAMGANCIAYDALEPDVYLYMTQPTVAVGGTGLNSQSIVYSTDGMTWTNVTQAYLYQGRCVAWNGSIWIVGGEGWFDSMLYSSDGMNWNPIPNSKTILNTVNGMAYNGSLWVAGGSSLAYSLDGINWTTPTHSFMVVNEVVWNGTMWMAAGTGTALAYSYDGKNWTSVTSTLTIAQSIFYYEKWLAVGSGTDNLVYSYDGINWTGFSTFFSSVRSISHNGFMWVATGEGAVHTLAYSYDGFSWTGLGKTIFSNYGLGVTWNGSKWIATGYGANSIAYSVDGKNWIGLGNTALPIVYGVACQTDTKGIDAKMTTESLSLSVDVAQSGYKNLSIGVKGTLY